MRGCRIPELGRGPAFHRGPQAQGKRCLSQAQERPYPSTGDHALTWRPYPSTRGPWAHTDARPGPSTGGTPGSRGGPAGPCPHPACLTPYLSCSRGGDPAVPDCADAATPGAQRPSASSFKLTAIKRPGSANRVSRRRSKEPIVAELRRGGAAWEPRARKRAETAAGGKAGGRAPTDSALCFPSSVVLLFLDSLI